MKVSDVGRVVAIAGAAAVLPVVALAPQPQGRGETVAGLVDSARRSGLTGWELVDHATTLVRDSFDHYSAWHLWEKAERALSHGRGSSPQVNAVLDAVLRRLEFSVEIVHASRVRWEPIRPGVNPWWHTGHVWLRVTHDSETREVCAIGAGNRAGQVNFHPLTEVLPVHAWTLPAVRLGLLPFVTGQVWRQLLFGDDVPLWLYRDFDRR